MSAVGSSLGSSGWKRLFCEIASVAGVLDRASAVRTRVAAGEETEKAGAEVV